MKGKYALKEEKKAEIVEYFEGSANSASDFEYDENEPISEEQVLETLIEAEIELCSHCGWWSHQSEMELVDQETVCDQCREEMEEE